MSAGQREGRGFYQVWEKDKQQVFEILNRQGSLAVHRKGG